MTTPTPTPVRLVSRIAGVTPADIGALPVTARAIADGVAPLDSGLLVPIAHLPVGTSAGTVASGADPRLSDARTPLAHTHPQSQISGLTGELAARQPLAEKGQPSGYAGLDTGGKVPTAQLPLGSTATSVAAGNDPRLGDARAPLVHASTHASGGSDPLTVAALVGGTPTSGDVLAWSGTAWTASGRLTALEAVTSTPGEVAMFGDQVSTLPRTTASGSTSMLAGYHLTSVVVPRTVTGLTKLRFHIVAAALLSIVASPTISVYLGTNTAAGVAALPRVATVLGLAQSHFTTSGFRELALSATLNLTAGQRLAVLVYTPSGAFLTAATLASTPQVPAALLNPTGTLTTYSASRSASVTGPATLDLTTGWTPEDRRAWWGLA